MLEMVAKIVLGVVLIAAGIAMLVLPGPGLVVIAIGLALVLSQSNTGRRLLARLRVYLRDRFGSPRVREFEKRVPDEVFPPADTSELRLQARRGRRARPDDPSDDIHD